MNMGANKMIRFRVLCGIAALVFIFSAVWRLCDTVKSLRTEGFRITLHEPEEGPKDSTIAEGTGFYRGQSMTSYNFYSVASKPIREYNPRTGDSISIYPRKVMVCGVSDAKEKENRMTGALNKLNNALMLLALLIYIFIVVLFVMLIITIARQHFFRDKVVLWLRLIGSGFLMLFLVHTAARFLDSWFSDSMLGVDWLTVNYRLCIDWSSLVIGLFILAVSEIVKRALELQHENEQFI